MKTYFDRILGLRNDIKKGAKMMKLSIFVFALMILLTATSFADGLEITSVSCDGERGIHVVWEDSYNNAPYQVLYQPIFEGNENAPTGDYIVWCNSGDINECEYYELYTVPDADYWIVVCDNAGHQAVQKYEAVRKSIEGIQLKAKPQIMRIKDNSREFEDISNGRYSDPMTRISIDSDDVLDLSENEIYGLRLKITSIDRNMDSAYMLRYGISGMQFLMGGKDNIPNMPMVIGAMTDSSKPILLNREHTEQEVFIPLSDFIKNYMPESGSYALSVYVADACMSPFMLRIY